MTAPASPIQSVVNYVFAAAAAIALTAAVASSAMAQTTSAPATSAAQTGAAAGAVSAGKQAAAQPAAYQGKTRAEVQAEFIEARKNGLIPETEADYDVAQTKKHYAR